MQGTWKDFLQTFGRIGLMSFGGPTAQIAVMHKILVEEKQWLSDSVFTHALSFCMVLPGPEAMQLATYAGWRLRAERGGLLAGLLFVLPGAVVMLLLSALYAVYGGVVWVDAIFFGIKAAVLAIVIQALSRLAKRALRSLWHYIIAVLSFIGIFFFTLPFPALIACAALVGFLTEPAPVQSPASSSSHATLSERSVSLRHTAGRALVWGSVWVAPLLGMMMALGDQHLLVRLGLFFMQLALVTFGGAYAVLAYMAQDVVSLHGWLDAGEMMTGLGLAETTPGPLILVTEYVGFLAAFKQGGVGAGLMGAGIALWMTFAPCFLWIFTGGPYLEWIIARPRLKGALAAITAAVVGVIFNLSVWFAVHVFFDQVETIKISVVTLLRPDLGTLNQGVVVIALVSAVLLIGRAWSMGAVLAVASLLGLGWRILL